MEETVASLIKNRQVQEEETRDATETKDKMDLLLYFFFCFYFLLLLTFCFYFLLYFSISYVSITLS